MIEGYDNYQLELFKEAGGGMPPRPQGRRFFKFIRRYEKKIIVFIGIAFICIVAFSYGVKRGREISSLRNQPRFDLAVKKQHGQAAVKPAPEKTTAVRRREPLSPPPNDEKEKQKTQVDAGEYTIQLASYKAKKTADSQANALKQKGMSSFILQKGNYIILCVGRFPNKEAAKNWLIVLRKDYKDCYLRRL